MACSIMYMIVSLRKKETLGVHESLCATGGADRRAFGMAGFLESPPEQRQN